MLPTGGGKSAIYELAGLLRPGPTVVVSPLIALQQDQVAHVHAAGLPAIVLNSHQSPREHAASLAATRGETFVFLAPEQLGNAQTREAVRRAKPDLFVVDEAHLISQWGHDFRPDYMRLSALADLLDVPVRIALTATAAQPVRDEICRRLGLRDPEVVVGDFDRPNIELTARGFRSVDEKHEELEAAAGDLDGAGIVYAATHGGAQAAHDVLVAAGHSVALYHAGLGARARREAMSAYLDGSVSIVAATVAFGMGIDKPDVRWVLHFEPPPSLDAYYQEIGRVGRDGKPAHARLLYRPEDFGAAVHFVARGVSGAAVSRVAQSLAASETVHPTRRRRRRSPGWPTWVLRRGMRRARSAGRARSSVEAVVAASEAETERENEVERSRLDMMRRYAEHTGCRRSFLLSYFGQDYPGRCGNCDNDHDTAVAETAEPRPFAIGERISSERWGEGTVQHYDGDQLTVLFDDHGYRDLLVPLVIERRLLRRV